MALGIRFVRVASTRPTSSRCRNSPTSPQIAKRFQRTGLGQLLKAVDAALVVDPLVESSFRLPQSEGFHVAGVRRRSGYLPIPRMDKLTRSSGERIDPGLTLWRKYPYAVHAWRKRPFRAPVVIDESIIFANNQEARVIAIERSTFTHEPRGG
jgi:hypothetical protein